MEWFRDRALTLVLMAMFLVCLAAQLVTGLDEYNATQREHGEPVVSVSGSLATGHPWEALFENWESEFLQMTAFVLLTTWLVQKGSPESRRPGAKELVDTDPRDFADDPEAPWPVRRGGWILRLHEHSLGLAFVLLFLLSRIGHALGGFADYAADEVLHRQPEPAFTDYVTSSRFWFESFQNWQSEFLAIAAMVWLAVHLRQRWSRSRVEPYDSPHRPARTEEGPEPAIREDALDEVLAQPRIVEPPFFLDRQEGKTGDHGVGKQPAARLQGHPGRAVHLDALEPARGVLVSLRAVRPNRFPSVPDRPLQHLSV